MPDPIPTDETEESVPEAVDLFEVLDNLARHELDASPGFDDQCARCDMAWPCDAVPTREALKQVIAQRDSLTAERAEILAALNDKSREETQ